MSDFAQIDGCLQFWIEEKNYENCEIETKRIAIIIKEDFENIIKK